MARQKKYHYGLSNSVHSLFSKLSKSTIETIHHKMAGNAFSNGLTYTDDHGKTTAITLTLRPRVIDVKKRNALWQMTRILDGAFQKIAPLYFQIPSFDALFPFESRERDWISILNEPGYVPGRIASRWDSNTTFGDQDWKEGFSFLKSMAWAWAECGTDLRAPSLRLISWSRNFKKSIPLSGRE